MVGENSNADTAHPSFPGSRSLVDRFQRALAKPQPIPSCAPIQFERSLRASQAARGVQHPHGSKTALSLLNIAVPKFLFHIATFVRHGTIQLSFDHLLQLAGLRFSRSPTRFDDSPLPLLSPFFILSLELSHLQAQTDSHTMRPISLLIPVAAAGPLALGACEAMCIAGFYSCLWGGVIVAPLWLVCSAAYAECVLACAPAAFAPL